MKKRYTVKYVVTVRIEASNESVAHDVAKDIGEQIGIAEYTRAGASGYCVAKKISSVISSFKGA